MNINYFMSEALIEAGKAYKLNEVPIGAILVDNKSEKIISRGHNQINKFNNAIKHCEIEIISETCEKLKLEHIGYKCVNRNEIQKIN